MTLQHKLIPSLIGDMRLREKDFSSDVGTLFWSYVLFHTKYSGSSSYHHLQGYDSFNNDICDSKPFIIVTVSGDPKENPRCTKSIKCAIDSFTT